MSRQALEERAAYLREQNDLVMAVMAAKAAYPDYRLPDPLERCSRCGEHAAMYKGQEGTKQEGEFLCGHCGSQASIFTMPMPSYDIRQVAADVALAHKEAQDDPD